MKFGGTSVADLNIMRSAILKIVEEVKNKKKVIVVVSAMGSTTDHLVRKVKEVSAIYDAREYDAILSTGENISASIMALLLQNEGINSRSWQGWQIPIITTDNHSNARILDINTKNLEKRFANGMQVAVVAGFPLGILLAVGRASKLPAVKILDTKDVVVVFPCEPVITIFLMKDTICPNISPLV